MSWQGCSPGAVVWVLGEQESISPCCWVERPRGAPGPHQLLLVSGKTTSGKNFSPRLPEMCVSERLGVVFSFVRDSDFYFVMLEMI